MEKELNLESDMKISVYNETTSSITGSKSHHILGELSVPVTSLQTLCDRPQFYNLINEEGMFVGQVLANFHLKYFQKDPKKRNQENISLDQHPEHKEIMQKL